MPRRSIANQVGPEPVVEILTRRPSQAKRDRSWERRQRETVGVVNYRGIPAELNARIKSIAAELGVPIGDVARAFLEYALQAYQRGDMELTPKLAAERFTLHPREND